MKSLVRAIPYLVLNVIVSAAVTLLVLGLWERSQQTGRPLLPFLDRNSSGSGKVSSPLKPALPDRPIPEPDQALIEIQNVFGVGDLQSESVVLKRLGDGELWLTHWTLQDEDGNGYIFPDLLLNKDGAVEVFTRAGRDSVIELHWGLDRAVWSPGETVRLVDPNGHLRASFTIP